MSTLNVANITDGTDTVATGYVVNGSAKALANFDGTSSPLSVRESLNLSSITDGGTGKYTVNYTSSMANAVYINTFTVQHKDANDDGNLRLGGLRKGTGIPVTSSSTPFQGEGWFNATSANFDDSNHIHIATFGDLA